MTRATIFRIIVAMKLLPNFTAYWYMLPRRMKKVRTPIQATFGISHAALSSEWEKAFQRATSFPTFIRLFTPITVIERRFLPLISATDSAYPNWAVSWR